MQHNLSPLLSSECRCNTFTLQLVSGALCFMRLQPLVYPAYTPEQAQL